MRVIGFAVIGATRVIGFAVIGATRVIGFAVIGATRVIGLWRHWGFARIVVPPVGEYQ